MDGATVILLILAFFVIVTLFRTARIVPTQSVFVVERLGKYRKNWWRSIYY